MPWATAAATTKKRSESCADLLDRRRVVPTMSAMQIQLRSPHVFAALLALAVGACEAPAGSAHLPATNAVGPYSGSVISYPFCFASGKIGKRGIPFASEAESAIDAVEAELARSGLTLSDVVSTTVYLTEMSFYAEFNGIYARRFTKPYPARTCVAVKELPVGARVEVTVIARRH
jgi:2-iminobutanoate/2-iminopropanoate deaminase